MMKGRDGGRLERVLLCAGMVVAVGLEATRAAWADDSAEAEGLIRQGVELREQGRDERALPLFQKAYEVFPSPRTEGQLGLVETATGYWLQAEQHLTEALQSSDHPWIAKNRRLLDEDLAMVRQHLGDITVEGEPAGASVTVNRRPGGVLPLTAPLRVPSGKAVIEVSARGYAPATESVQITGGDSHRVTVALKKLAPAASAPGPGSGGAVAAMVTTPSPAEAKETGGASDLRRRIGWGAAIGAGAFLAAAVVETIIWQAKRSDFETHVGPPADNPQLAPSLWQPNCGGADPGRGGPGCSSLYDSMHRAEILAMAGYAAGALATGAAFLLLTGGHEASGPRLACGASVSPSIATCRLSF